jgi:cytochrome c
VLAAAFLGIVLSTFAAAQSPETRALLERYKCNVCHAERETKTGPAYLDIAARYRGDPRAASKLAGEVRRGAHGAGPWHMPPHPEVTEADAKKLVRYVLSLHE